MTPDPKNPMFFIRKYVFGTTQIGFSNMVGVSQPTIVEWEQKGYCHWNEQVLIHNLARRLKLDWSPEFFFEIPSNWRSRYGG